MQVRQGGGGGGQGGPGGRERGWGGGGGRRPAAASPSSGAEAATRAQGGHKDQAGRGRAVHHPPDGRQVGVGMGGRGQRAEQRGFPRRGAAAAAAAGWSAPHESRHPVGCPNAGYQLQGGQVGGDGGGRPGPSLTTTGTRRLKGRQQAARVQGG